MIDGPTYENPYLPNNVTDKSKPQVKPSYETKISFNSNTVGVQVMRSNERISSSEDTSLIREIGPNSF
jgi:hypothetical protein